MNAGSGTRGSAREIGLVAAGLCALTAAALWLADGAVLFTRPLWVDEWFTVLTVSERSPLRVLAHLRHGADGGAALYHLLVWAVGALTGSLAPATLRVISLLLMWATLVLVYVTLRRTFARHAAGVGTLAVGAHALVVAHAFEARFYALWIACCALFAWTLSRSAAAGGTRRGAVAVASVLLCTSHWYGIFSLGLMCAAAVIVRGRPWRDSLVLVAPALAGVAACALVLPLALGQRAAVTVDTWIPEFAVGQLRALSATFWTSTVPVVAAALIAAAWLLGRTRPSARTARAQELRRAAWHALSDPGAAALLSLALMPLVLAALSLVGQPSMIARYGIPAVLAWAPLAALAARLGGRWVARAAAVALAMLWFTAYAREAARKNAFALGIAHERRVVADALATGIPLAFQSQHTMYPSMAAEPSGRSGAMFVDLPDSTLEALFPRDSRWYQLNKGIRLERDFARVHAKRFGFPVLASQQTLDAMPRFMLVASPARLPRGIDDITALARATFPRHQVTQLGENLLLLERPDARSLPGRNTSR